MADEPKAWVEPQNIEDAPLDPAMVTFLPTYRVGFLPPEPGSLPAGQLYIELTTPDAPGSPVLWMGMPAYLNAEGNMGQLLTMPAAPSPSKREARQEERDTQREERDQRREARREEREGRDRR